MLQISCDRCGADLDAPGMLVFGVPDHEGRCAKYHICQDCYPRVLEVISRYPV